MVKRWHKRRSLPADSNICTAKIGDRGDSGACGNQIRVAYLQGVGRHGVGLMPHGLAVAADSPNFACHDAGLFKNLKRRTLEALANLSIERPNVV